MKIVFAVDTKSKMPKKLIHTVQLVYTFIRVITPINRRAEMLLLCRAVG